jgi:hypothetical protein
VVKVCFTALFEGQVGYVLVVVVVDEIGNVFGFGKNFVDGSGEGCLLWITFARFFLSGD